MPFPTAPSPFLVALLVFFILPLVFSPNGGYVRLAEGGKGRVHITDELDDVVDDEEDDTWKEWGKKPTPQFDLPPEKLEKMELSEIQAETLKRHSGPILGFIKLRLGVKRTKDMVVEIATRWSKVLRTGSIAVKFMGIDLSTVMVTIERGQDLNELKDFVLNQPEAYELKIGDQYFRRPGDPPLEEVVEMLQNEKMRKENDGSTESNKQVKEEL
ncbi:PREDICTED: uncharacterized protein LOC101313939 [Fragaria vesca subsp. vesca]|uniref:uncharacterized protein LOC101313939 n=1 Tax=Fragaria vesca subsp. vesca TaxID=101020 RepID=UPI0002C3039F|nr:PREDICTED: uncharacterized protein LOC101313939 [Fragaria vesca subsp. vesca]